MCDMVSICRIVFVYVFSFEIDIKCTIKFCTQHFAVLRSIFRITFVSLFFTDITVNSGIVSVHSDCLCLSLFGFFHHRFSFILQAMLRMCFVQWLWFHWAMTIYTVNCMYYVVALCCVGLDVYKISINISTPLIWSYPSWLNSLQ